MDNPTLILIAKIFAIFFLLVGSIFSLIGMIGVTRLPDVYTRLHVTGKVSAFGAVLLLAAAILIVDDLTLWKGLILIIFLLLASPVVSHVISSAAYKSGVPLSQASRDDLAKALPREASKDV